MPEPKKKKNIIKKIIPAATRSNYKNKKKKIDNLKEEYQELNDNLNERTKFLLEERGKLKKEVAELKKEWEQEKSEVEKLYQWEKEIWEQHLEKLDEKIDELKHNLLEKEGEINFILDATKDGRSIYQAYIKQMTTMKAVQRESDTTRNNYRKVKDELERIRRENAQVKIIELENENKKLKLELEAAYRNQEEYNLNLELQKKNLLTRNEKEIGKLEAKLNEKENSLQGLQTLLNINNNRERERERERERGFSAEN